MKSKRSRIALIGVLALVLSVTVGLASGSIAEAKKKKKSGGTADITKQVNQTVPDATATTDGLLTSTITIGGKKFNKTKVRDVNVTLQGTGDTGGNNGSAADIAAQLTAPNGASTWLIDQSLSGQSFGPLTFDDETFFRVAGLTADAPNDLASPYVGSMQPDCFSAHGGCTLSVNDNGPASGTWTLRVFDRDNGQTTVLNFWRLVVVAGKPFKT
jgi:subtilisin-like proprotein convertase family protein